jgi:hypothetical protein
MKRSLLLLFVIGFSAAALGQTSCANNNSSSQFWYNNAAGTEEHIAGDHDYHSRYWGQCLYSSPTYAGYCTLDSWAYTDNVNLYDNEDVYTLLWGFFTTHKMNFKTGNGHAHSPGGDATSDTQGDFAVKSCGFSCDIPQISVTGGGVGGGWIFTVNPSNPIFQAQTTWYKNPCPREHPISDCGNPVTCGTGGGTPLIADTKANGFHFGDLKHCVNYDIGDHVVRCYSWPEPDSGNGWIVVDRGPGIDVEMLGNFSPHADDDYALPGDQKGYPPNGFIAMGYYGQRTRSGIIDKNDAAWSSDPATPETPRLRVWIDEHCRLNPGVRCYALRSELHVLEEFWSRISYVYSRTEIQDKQGNRFLYWAEADPDVEHHEPQKPKDPLRDMRISDVIPVYQKQ